MTDSKNENFNVEYMNEVTSYVSSVEGLVHDLADNGAVISVHQLADKKMLRIHASEIAKVLRRNDGEGKPFLQVNFHSGKKILLTENLIGFKPAPVKGLDIKKLPKVVTTPDLLSVFEAIEEAVSSNADMTEVDTLKKVYSSILAGGENIGLDLSQEKHWVHFLFTQTASA